MLPIRRARRSSGPQASGRQARIAHRTEHLPATSRILYRIEHYSTLPVVGLLVIASVVGAILFGVALHFSTQWVAVFEVSVSAVTLAMVVAIQHTQAREQAATQRKLDELLRALPGADQSLMMLEEAPKEALFDVEESQRGVRSAVD